MADFARAPDLHWVFGYGSLIWRPGFRFVASQQALLRGAHRSLCIYSHEHRGTPEEPGLVFGLRRGGACRGMAFGVDAGDWPDVRAYLQEREQVTGVYREATRAIRLADGAAVPALTFMVDENHVQYAGRLAVDEQLVLVRRGHGHSGANVDYVLNTVRHLRAMGITDPYLFALADRLENDARAA